MKLRLQSNSIRLRLKRGEVERVAKIGRVEETVSLGAGPEATFRYVLEASATATEIRAILHKNEIVVQVPAETIARWAFGDDVGIETLQSVAPEGELQVLIEKDFACLTGPAQENVDTFPNPLAGTKC